MSDPVIYPAPSSNSGVKTAVVAGALVALVAANVYLYIQVDRLCVLYIARNQTVVRDEHLALLFLAIPDNFVRMPEQTPTEDTRLVRVILKNRRTKLAESNGH